MRSSERDAVAIRAVAAARVVAAVVLAASGSFVSELRPEQSSLFLVLGLAWLPAAVVVLFAADGNGHPLAVYGGPVVDLVALASVYAFMPASATAALWAAVVGVAFATYTAGTRFGGVIAGGSVGLALAARAWSPRAAAGSDLAAVTLFAVVAAGIIFLLDRTATVQSRTAARSARFEDKATAIFTRVADAVVVTDAGGEVLEWSPAAERILGTPARAAQGQACAKVLGLHVGERQVDCSNGCPLLEDDRFADELLGHEAWRESGGRRQPLLVTVSAVQASDGSTVEVVHSLRDVTRLKQAEEAKTLFLATASHELKTPLAVISGFAELLASEAAVDEATRRQALEAINRRARELSRIVDRLLLSSRIEAGRVQVALSAVDVVPIVVERVSAVAAARQWVVTLTMADDVPLALADPQAVVTVIDHLLDNAVKYSPDGEPVEVEIVTSDGDVSVAVRDRGIGMDAEQARCCFDKFWQAESSDVRRFGGSGIGLYIVRSLVEAMDGTVTVESTVGEGTTFTVELRGVATAGMAPAPHADDDVVVGERTSIREFMRQIGVPQEVDR